jgi:uncharacterized protein involved in propanediol utilization
MLDIGSGAAIAHHGEILQGVYTPSDGCAYRALVTLPYPQRQAQATFRPTPGQGITVEPAWKTKAGEAARLALHCCGQSAWGGHVTITNSTPPRWGFGSSTSDVTATIRAVSAACQMPLPATVVARLAVEAEAASDAIMFEERAVLFAHRAGVVLEDLGGALPPLEVVGLNTDPTELGVETLHLPPMQYSSQERDLLHSLVAQLRQAVAQRDPHLVGQVAWMSARLNQRHLPKPGFPELEQLVTEVEALGLQVSHSGTIVGLLFDPRDSRKERKIRHVRSRLRALGFTQTWRFCTARLGQHARPTTCPYGQSPGAISG